MRCDLMERLRRFSLLLWFFNADYVLVPLSLRLGLWNGEVYRGLLGSSHISLGVVVPPLLPFTLGMGAPGLGSSVCNLVGCSTMDIPSSPLMFGALVIDLQGQYGLLGSFRDNGLRRGFGLLLPGKRRLIQPPSPGAVKE